MSSLNGCDLTAGSKMEHKIFLGTWLKKINIKKNLKMNYITNIKNLIKPIPEFIPLGPRVVLITNRIMNEQNNYPSFPKKIIYPSNRLIG